MRTALTDALGKAYEVKTDLVVEFLTVEVTPEAVARSQQMSPDKLGEAGLRLELVPTTDAVFAEIYRGVRVRVVNGTNDVVWLPASDYRLMLTQQAQTSTGRWVDLEYPLESWCGNSYFDVGLPAGEAWELVGPLYKGSYACQMRFSLIVGDDVRIYSSAYPGHIDPKLLRSRRNAPVDQRIWPQWLEPLPE